MIRRIRTPIPCAGFDPEAAARLCSPECTRWSQVNAGDPIRYFHDKSGWDPTVTVNPIAFDAPDPDVYMLPGMAIWESAYPCGNLFEEQPTAATAQMIIRYLPNTPGGPSGTASCFCDANDDVCVRQFDHSTHYSESNPALLTIYQATNGRVSVNSFSNLYTHELGHILGMGHVFGLPDVVSVMGSPLNQNRDLVLYSFDALQLRRRYPCACTITNNIVSEPPGEVPVHNQTGSFCPGCA